MFPKLKVTEIYCMANDFYKGFALQQEKYMCLCPPKEQYEQSQFIDSIIV